MKTISLDLRERILSAYQAGENTREEIADRFMVSLGMVKKLIQQQRHTNNIAPRHKNSGRKPTITEEHRAQIKILLAKKLDMTLHELRDALGLQCSLPAIHYVLADMNLTFKKRHCAPVSKTDPMLRPPARSGKPVNP